ncbi:MAG: VWA domain-containing protein [Thermoanaerobaculia bacterium]
MRPINVSLLFSLLVVMTVGLPVESAAQAPPAVSEMLEVRLMNVDFIVTDPSGAIVAGLEGGDFELLEEGKAQKISNFSEFPSGSTAGQSGKRIILYFDRTNLSTANRDAAIEASRELLKKHLGPNDRAMIATWSGKLETPLTWSGEIAATDAALAALAKQPALSPARLSEQRALEASMDELTRDDPLFNVAVGPASAGAGVEMVMASVRRYAASVRGDVLQQLDALQKTLLSASDTDGRKVLLLFSESMPARPGADMLQRTDGVREKIQGRGSPGGRNLAISEAANYDLGEAFGALARSANAAGVMIYAVNPRTAGTGQRGSGNVERVEHTEGNVEFALDSQASDGLQILARETGGRVFAGVSPATASGMIDAELGSWYSLGYRAAPAGPAVRRLEIKPRDPKHVVRARSQVFYRSIVDEMSERVVAHQLMSPTLNELGIRLDIQDPQTVHEGKKVQPVRILVPADRLTLVASGAQVTGGFSVFVCSGDGKGKNSGVNMQTHPIQWPKEVLAHTAGRDVTYIVQVPVDSKMPQVSVGVIDHVSQQRGFARTSLK